MKSFFLFVCLPPSQPPVLTTLDCRIEGVVSVRRKNSPPTQKSRCDKTACVKNGEGQSLFTVDSANAHFADIVRRAALPVNPGDLITHQIQRAARRLRLDPGLAKRLWYGEQRVMPPHVALNLLEFDRQAGELRSRLNALQAEIDALGGRSC